MEVFNNGVILCALKIPASTGTSVLPIAYTTLNRACVTEIVGCGGYVARVSSLTLTNIVLMWDTWYKGGQTDCFAIIMGY